MKGQEMYQYDLVFGKHQGENKRIVALDTEWAKNWKSETKHTPFCASLHSIYINNNIDIIDIDRLHMRSCLFFRSEAETTQEYIEQIDRILEQYIDRNTIMVGHQICSDLHTMRNYSRRTLPAIEYLISAFKTRNIITEDDNFRVADTRYDIKNRVRGGGEEKLRSVSLRLGIFAVQYELDKMSLTKMYNQYLSDSDSTKREMLQVVNWRHAFQTSLVWLTNHFYEKKIFNSKFNREFLVTNDIIREMGYRFIDYLNSPEYACSMTLRGIVEYVNRYNPDMLARLNLRLSEVEHNTRG